MRRVVLLLCVLALAACGDSDGSVDAPIKAPNGGGELMRDFFTICSTAINSNPAAALKTGEALYWEQMDDDTGANMPVDIGTHYQLMHSETDLVISIFHYDTAIETGTGCSIFVTNEAGQINPRSLKQLKGFKGRWVDRDGNGAGRWIKRSGNSILSVSGNQRDENFAVVNMNTYTLK